MNALLKNTENTPIYPMLIRNIGLKGKPLDTTITTKAHMDIMIWWCNRAHGDPENCFGSIADALFASDKYLSGSFNFKYAEDKKARVEVVIQLEDISNK